MLVAALKTKVKMNRIMKAGFLLSGDFVVPVVFHSRNVQRVRKYKASGDPNK
jgi:hypothetical protein